MAVSTGGGEDEVMSTINITPFTDVLLVLLIIFIILASVTKEPKLPDAYNKDKVQPSQIVVMIDEHDHVQIGSNQVEIHDAKAPYGIIIRILDAAKQAGLEDVGFVTS